jgi:hypothetical protein
VGRVAPDLVWAHHFDLLPAWLLARAHRVPLLSTFHGPIVGAQRPNDPQQALGMVLGALRADTVSGVSAEILHSLDSLRMNADKRTEDGESERPGDASGSLLLPNCVSLVPSAPPRHPPRRLLMITRPDKQDHIRQAVLFLGAYRRLVAGATLDLIIGRNPEDELAATRTRNGRILEQGREALRLLGGSWCLAQRRQGLRTFAAVRFRGFVADPSPCLQRADAVIGMGRVVLEGLAHGRSAVLAGYDALHGPVRADNVQSLRYANFSGRGVQAMTPDDAAAALLADSTATDPVPTEIQRLIDVDQWQDALAAAFDTTAATPAAGGAERELAVSMLRHLAQGPGGLPRAFSLACETFTCVERQALYRIGSG